MSVILYLSKFRCTTSKLNSNVNCGLWVFMLCRYRFIISKKIKLNKKKNPYLLMRNVDNEGNCAGIYG